MEIIKSEKMVGIIIHNSANLFTNGITQNAYFICQCLEKAGFKCQLLCHESNPVPFKYKNLTLKQISTDTSIFNPEEYHTIITVTRPITREIYNLLKKYNIRVISFICGNACCLDEEEFFVPKSDESTGFFGFNKPIDETWIIPSFEFSIDYFEAIYNKPSFIVPHLWSPSIFIERFIEDKKLDPSFLYYNINNHTANKLNIGILEPNINYVKTAWIPIIACERLNTLYPSLLDNVYVFNFPEHKRANNMISRLALGKKLKKMSRMETYKVLYHFNSDTASFPIFVSHQKFNTLNYLYYELLYFGYPLVHNSPDLEDCGYYYPGCNIAKCVEQILYAQKHHNKNIKQYREKALKFLERVNPFNSDVIQKWDGMVTDSISRGILQNKT